MAESTPPDRWGHRWYQRYNIDLTVVQVPEMAGNWGLIDLATPRTAYKKQAFNDPSQEMTLVFSDEFDVDGRTFYPGDDPYWEAVDLHYWQVRTALHRKSLFIPTDAP